MESIKNNVEPENSSPVCPTCGCHLATKRAPKQYENRAEYLRFKRKSYAIQGICTRCMRNKVDLGYKRCAECRKADHRIKIMRRRIGSKLCGCGNPATNILHGEYICPECWRLEGGHKLMFMKQKGKK